MSITLDPKGIAAGAILSASVLLGGLGLTEGAAHAQPGNSWPGCPPDSPSGPCRWCPGDPPVQTGNIKVNPVVWDNNACHTYWYVYFGQGNVAQNIFEGETPPPPPPPPPPAIISTREQCLAILGPVFCPRG